MTNKEEFIKEMDTEMSKKSFEYFFTEILEFEFSDHHKDWLQGLHESRRYCVKASRDHGKSVFFMSYALWLAAFKPNTHIMIFSHSLEQTLEHMRFIRNLIESKDILKDLKPQGRPWNKSYFEFTNKSRLMAKSVVVLLVVSTRMLYCVTIFCGVLPLQSYKGQRTGFTLYFCRFCTTLEG